MISLAAIMSTDLPLLVDMEKQVFEQDVFPLPLFGDLLVQPNTLGRVARKNGKIAGYMLCRWVGDDAEVLTLAVHPDFRRQGIASELLNESFVSLWARGVRKIYLEVRLSNVAAQRLYESFDGKQIGVRQGYYTAEEDGTAEDAYVYRIDLTCN